ncbi:aminotransferase family protein [Nocardia bovistercoris]|uniref:Aspartate aminotransferase family protein n=1 Tax=Nocardia bovistercoris TaxID=2785916 RepID=A0A931I5D4_9NOCA|nr:aminotransferase class III-fold pyridoxal phosphate-dependent enzyme [Nocardia bovistercoris]MBH0775152.1 aspartate aminotransferase family protein [Nocardia bovistercoris]
MSALWHGFADMGAVERDGPFVVARGDGAYIWDAAGKRYLDATAGLWFANIGHGRAEVADAVAAQLRTIAHYSNFGDTAEPVTAELARRVAAIAPVPDSKVFFTSGGSDSVDTAVKLARRYWREVGRPAKSVVVGRSLAYHGMHVGGTALAGIPRNHEGYGELMADARTVAWDDATALLALVDRLGADRIAAFLCEPVMGAGGVHPPPPGYLGRVREICRAHDILFVADEVVTGFGRIGGHWFASTRFGLEPDILLAAKGLTSGYMPMGAVVVAPRVAEPFFAGGVWWRHGYTYGGHAGAAAAASATLAITEREHLLAAATRLEAVLLDRLAPLADHPAVAEVRGGVGALAAVQLADPDLAAPMVKVLRAHGVSSRAVGQGALQISPPLITTDEQVDELASGFARALG